MLIRWEEGYCLNVVYTLSLHIMVAHELNGVSACYLRMYIINVDDLCRVIGGLLVLDRSGVTNQLGRISWPAPNVDHPFSCATVL